MIIDYLTVTIFGKPTSPGEVSSFLDGHDMHELYMQEPCDELAAWRPFSSAWGNSVFRVQWRDSDNWSSLSVTGKGCEVVRDELQAFIAAHVDNITRIDLAQDANEHSFSPVAHASNVTSRTKAIIQSDTGETLYIGSRSSDSFVRVYRYKEPHPRAGNTRVEAEFKRDYARTVSAHVAADGPNSLPVMAWIVRKSALEGHLMWRQPATESTKPMVANRKEGQDGYTAWLYKAAIPAVRKALREGLIEKRDIFME